MRRVHVRVRVRVVGVVPKESVHFRQELVQCLIPFVVAVGRPSVRSGLGHSIEFVDEDDGGRWSPALMAMATVIAIVIIVVVAVMVVVVVVVAGRPHRLPQRPGPGPGPPPLPHPPLPLPIVLERRGPGLSKERPDPSGTPPHIDFAKVAPAADAKGVAIGLTGNGPGNHGFSDPGTPVQQNAPGKLRPQNDKSRRIPEVGNNLSNLGEYGVESRHVVEGDSGACACACALFVVVVVVVVVVFR
mmetsp:Transcript_23641/g.55628  ORF Transcript_23641/g.55628 Transcript_23641/m.55628 type:complete len:244 (+) Transcript_23641:845-1576(+)